MEQPKIIKKEQLEWFDNFLGGKEGHAGKVSLNPLISSDPNARGLAIILGEVNPGSINFRPWISRKDCFRRGSPGPFFGFDIYRGGKAQTYEPQPRQGAGTQ